MWIGPDQFSLDIAKRQIQGALAACPDAAVVFRFHLNPPAWWLAQNPTEQVAYEPGTPAQVFEPLHLSRIVQDDAGLPVRVSLASEKWRSDAGAMLARFCREFSKTHEGDALIGIHVAGGVYGEWHQWGFIEHEADFSQPMQAHFQRWLREKYGDEQALQKSWNDPAASFATVEIPTPAERATVSGGLFRDPQKDQKTIDYYRCQHELVADDILHFCKIVKENWNRPILTGAFYGYFFSMFNRQAAGGHLELQRVLASPWIDYLSAPQVYYPDDGYDPGEPYRSRSLVRSITLHGKLWLDEYDQQPRRTFPVLNGKDNAENYRRNVQENIAALRRNVLSPLTKGAGLWFYDFGPSGMNLHRSNEHDIQSGTIGYWDHPAYLAEIKALKTLADSLVHRPWQSAADVLVVYDTEVFYHMKSALPDSCPISSQVVDWLPLALYYAGVAFDAVHLDDLELLDLSPYRAVIFANTWLLDATEKQVIREKVAQGGRHLFWIYAPGFSDGKALRPEAVSEVTGFELERTFTDKPPVVPLILEDEFPEYQRAWGVLNPLFGVRNKIPASFALDYEHAFELQAFTFKKEVGHTSWFVGIPLTKASWWHFFFLGRHNADAHFYFDFSFHEGSVIYAGGGLLVFHTKAGGEHKINLKNGKGTVVKMPMGAGTVALDAETGRVVLE
ncbi:MAG: beta-galactosidase [Saprospiraceae bacterium]|nr:beta-galactosidase [Saprospiraceae bacterium]